MRNYIAERAGPLADIHGQGKRGQGRVPRLKWLMWETIAQSGAFDEQLGMCFEDGPSALEAEPEPTWVQHESDVSWEPGSSD